MVGPRIIVRFGQKAIERWITRAIPEDPEVAAAQHRPMDPYMKRLMAYASWHFSQVMTGVLGKLDQEVSEKLKQIGIGGDGKLDLSKVSPDLIKQVTGGAGLGGLEGLASLFGNGGKGKGKGGGWTDALAMMSAFGQMQQGGSAALVAGPGGLPAGHPLNRR